MRIQTFSVVAGSTACDARCPYCVSKMTVDHLASPQEPKVNWRRFDVACRLAAQCGVTTAMITGKGEPTLFPDQVGTFVRKLANFFPIIELQTNGISIAENRRGEMDDALSVWRDSGLTTVCVSVVHHDAEFNRLVFAPYKDEGSHFNLGSLISKLHRNQLSVRLSVVMVRDYGIWTPDGLQGMIDFCKMHQVEQLTVRSVNNPSVHAEGDEQDDNDEYWAWTERHSLSCREVDTIANWVREKGTLLLQLSHGALVYDIDGQNLCLTDSLTVNEDKDFLRQLIFFPDGHLRYSWEYRGAVLL